MALPLRSTLEGMGYKVDWDDATKNIGLTSPTGYQSTLYPGSYNIDPKTSRAMVDPTVIQSQLINPANYQKTSLTPESITNYQSIAEQLYKPQQNYYQQALDKRLSSLQGVSDAQNMAVDAGYQQAHSNLTRAEDAARMQASHNVASRNLSSSPLAEYQRRKTSEAYAPEYQQLESNKAAGLANIAAQAISAAENLAASGLEQEAAFAQRIGDAAYNMAMTESQQQNQWLQDALKYLSGAADIGLSQDQLGFQKQQYTNSPEAQPWYNDLAKQSMLADIDATRRSNTGGYSGGGGGTGVSSGGDSGMKDWGSYLGASLNELKAGNVKYSDFERDLRILYEAGDISPAQYEQGVRELKAYRATLPPKKTTTSSTATNAKSPGLQVDTFGNPITPISNNRLLELLKYE